MEVQNCYPDGFLWPNLWQSTAEIYSMIFVFEEHILWGKRCSKYLFNMLQAEINSSSSWTNCAKWSIMQVGINIWCHVETTWVTKMSYEVEASWSMDHKHVNDVYNHSEHCWKKLLSDHKVIWSWNKTRFWLFYKQEEVMLWTPEGGMKAKISSTRNIPIGTNSNDNGGGGIGGRTRGRKINDVMTDKSIRNDLALK